MTISLTPMPAGASAHALLPDTDPTSGVITFTARPSRHAWAVSQTMLEAFGIRSDVFGAGRAHGEDVELLRVWLRAYDIGLVIVRHATNLQDSKMLDSLVLLTEEVGAHLALTCDDNAGTHLFDWVETVEGEIHIDESNLAALIAERVRQVSETQDTDCAPEFPILLPRVDFYGFRARCRDTLSSENFGQVDRLYQDVFLRVQGDPFGTKEEAAERLTSICSEQSGIGQVRTVVRAAQAAMFTREVLLKVDLDRFLNLVRDECHRRLSREEVHALRAYRTPWRSSVVVLRDCNLSRDDIKGLRLSDISDEGNLTVRGAWEVPVEAMVYLRAQKLMRKSEGARDDDSFVAEGKPTIALAQRRVGGELGIPSTRGGEFTSTRAADRWQHEFGVTMLPLVKAHLPGTNKVKGDST